MPGMYAPQESSFRGFNDNQYAVFQRKNRKLIQHVMTGSDLDDERLQQMMKMVGLDRKKVSESPTAISVENTVLYGH